ncbi:hypothetical protein M446_6893 [Methylobacterium sp. 4-46]|nr:hypothetical protein M446_6893 [Methylobacterium sp. 4-46]
MAMNWERIVREASSLLRVLERLEEESLQAGPDSCAVANSFLIAQENILNAVLAVEEARTRQEQEEWRRGFEACAGGSVAP